MMKEETLDMIERWIKIDGDSLDKTTLLSLCADWRALTAKVKEQEKELKVAKKALIVYFRLADGPNSVAEEALKYMGFPTND